MFGTTPRTRWGKKKSPNLSYKYLKRSQVSFSSVVFCCLLKMFTLTLSSHPDLWEVWNIIVLAHFGCLYLPLLQICAFKIRYWQSGKTSAAALKAGLEIHPVDKDWNEWSHKEESISQMDIVDWWALIRRRVHKWEMA